MNGRSKSNAETSVKREWQITGIACQAGSYLAEFLLAKGYEVHGLIRRASTFNTDRIDHIYQVLGSANVSWCSPLRSLYLR